MEPVPLIDENPLGPLEKQCSPVSEFLQIIVRRNCASSRNSAEILEASLRYGRIRKNFDLLLSGCYFRELVELLFKLRAFVFLNRFQFFEQRRGVGKVGNMQGEFWNREFVRHRFSDSHSTAAMPVLVSKRLAQTIRRFVKRRNHHCASIDAEPQKGISTIEPHEVL